MERNEKTKKNLASEEMTLREKKEREGEAAGEKDADRQSDRVYSFIPSDSFFPHATHCTFLTHARTEIANTHIWLLRHTDRFAVPNSSTVEQQIEKNFS